MEWFREGLRESGYLEGQNIAIDLRYAESAEGLRAMAGELVQSNVTVIYTAGDLAPKIAQLATSAVPIVATADDMVGAGLVTSLARPGGNLTGLTIFSPELSAKRLAVLKELVPKVSRVAILWDPATRSQLKATEDAARSLSVKLQVLEVGGRADLPRVFQAAKSGRAEALNVLASPLLSSLQQDIIDLAASHRLPAIYQWKEHVEAGGTHFLWAKPRGDLAAICSDRLQGSERHGPRHPANRATHQIRTGDQHEDGQAASSCDSVIAAAASGSGYSVTSGCPRFRFSGRRLALLALRRLTGAVSFNSQ